MEIFWVPRRQTELLHGHAGDVRVVYGAAAASKSLRAILPVRLDWRRRQLPKDQFPPPVISWALARHKMRPSVSRHSQPGASILCSPRWAATLMARTGGSGLLGGRHEVRRCDVRWLARCDWRELGGYTLQVRPITSLAVSSACRRPAHPCLPPPQVQTPELLSFPFLETTPVALATSAALAVGSARASLSKPVLVELTRWVRALRTSSRRTSRYQIENH